MMLTQSALYTNIRSIAELFYFIVLTGAMVYYAAKSYRKSVEAKPELIAHVYIDYKDRLERGQSCYPIYIELYNNGTGAAKNIMLSVDNEKLDVLTIFQQDLGFLQPQHSKFIPLGSLCMTLSENYISVFNDSITEQELAQLTFYIEHDGKEKEKINLNFAYLLNMPQTPVGRSSEEALEEKTEKQLATMNKTLARIMSTLDTLQKKIK